MGWKKRLMAGIGMLLAAGLGVAADGGSNRGLFPITAVTDANHTDQVLWIGTTFDRDTGRSSEVWDIAGTVCKHLKWRGWFQSNGLNSTNLQCEVISVVKFPNHGQLARLPDGMYEYFPDSGFLGDDMVQFTVNAEGKSVLVMWPILVREYEQKGE